MLSSGKRSGGSAKSGSAEHSEMQLSFKKAKHRHEDSLLPVLSIPYHDQRVKVFRTGSN